MKSLMVAAGCLQLPFLILLALPPALPVVLNDAKETAVDLALPAPQPPEHSGLGTMRVQPDNEEKAYFDKLPADQLVTGSMFQPYDLTNKSGKYVAWYGIIRKIKEDISTGRTTLTIQHTYSDAQTDAHMMTVSFNGSGDFVAKLQGVHLPLLPLRLIKVYGTVESYTESKPTVAADFLKEWDWGNFNFMDYGPDKRNPEWKSLCKVSESRRIYNPYPSPQYYRERLGDAPSYLYNVMTPEQVSRYAKKIPVNQSTLPILAMPLTAPLFVGQVVSVDTEHQGVKMPYMLALRELSDYVEFVKAGMAHRVAAIDKDHVAQIEPDTDVLVVKYALPDDLAAAAFLVRPQSGKLKDQEWWLPGFVLKAKTHPATSK